MNKLVKKCATQSACLYTSLISIFALMIFAFLEDPAVITISLIGAKHFPIYMVLAVIMTLTLVLNFNRLFTRLDYHNTKVETIAYIASIAGFFTALTTKSTPDFLAFYITHWVVALFFCIGVPVLAFIAINSKVKAGEKQYRGTLALFLGIFLADLIVTVTLFATLGIMGGKNGYIEIVVIANTLSMFIAFNNLDFDAIKAKQGK